MGRHRDAGLDFRAEAASVPAVRRMRGAEGSWLPGALLAGALAVTAIWAYQNREARPVVEGSLRLESDPQGAAVEVDGSLRGLTPLSLTLPPGTYAIAIVHAGHRQAFSAVVEGGVNRVHHINLPEPGLTASSRGRLQITSDPPGATVTVDGVPRGIAPISIEDLPPGEHEVATQHLGVTERRMIMVDPGSTASLLVTSPFSGEGWLVARASTRLQVFEGGRRIGTTDTERIALRTGVHTLEFAADELGFRVRRDVTIAAGQTTTMSIALPMATVDVNAEPWADVWIDGRRIGETPLANLLQPIGTHRVTFRHPELGERHASVTVSLKDTARVAVDMRVP
jgi:hypothetical protein